MEIEGGVSNKKDSVVKDNLMASILRQEDCKSIIVKYPEEKEDNLRVSDLKQSYLSRL